jgi:hypothetical protein
VPGAVGPFDRLFEAPRDEMSERNTMCQRIERAQTARPFEGFDRRLGLVAHRVDLPPLRGTLFGWANGPRLFGALRCGASLEGEGFEPLVPLGDPPSYRLISPGCGQRWPHR